MITLNLKNGCLFVLLLFVFGLIGVWYQQWEMESFYSQRIQECLENPPNDTMSKNEFKENIPEQKICDEACTLAPINSQITTIHTRLDKLEKTSDKHDILIKSNTDNMTKTTTKLKALLDEIEKTKAELDEATKGNK